MAGLDGGCKHTRPLVEQRLHISEKFPSGYTVNQLVEHFFKKRAFCCLFEVFSGSGGTNLPPPPLNCSGSSIDINDLKFCKLTSTNLFNGVRFVLDVRGYLLVCFTDLQMVDCKELANIPSDLLNVKVLFGMVIHLNNKKKNYRQARIFDKIYWLRISRFRTSLCILIKPSINVGISATNCKPDERELISIQNW